MLQDLWNGFLDLTARFVIPDWSSVVALLPVVILVLVVLVLGRIMFRLLRAPKPRRGKQRVAPRAPAGVHLPGPSFAPFFAAIGAFLLFLGLVFPGPILVLGVIALVLTLIYWLTEALRTYERDTGEIATPQPASTGVATIPQGPPPGVHMPGPSWRPLLGAFGTFMLMLGLVFPGWLLAVGVIALILTLVGWLADANREFGRTVEADRTGHLASGPAPRPPSRLFAALVILLVLGVALQAGWLPPSSASAGPSGAPAGSAAPGGSPAGSGGPIGSGGSGGPPPASGAAADVTLTAHDIAFDTTTLTAPAGKPFKLALVNQDTAPHNVAFKDSSGKSLWAGEPVQGPKTTVYDVPAIPAGSYTFLCTVHPTMTGTVTFQ
jgi:plastocyanin